MKALVDARPCLFQSHESFSASYGELNATVGERREQQVTARTDNCSCRWATAGPESVCCTLKNLVGRISGQSDKLQKYRDDSARKGSFHYDPERIRRESEE